MLKTRLKELIAICFILGLVGCAVKEQQINAEYFCHDVAREAARNGHSAARLGYTEKQMLTELEMIISGISN